LNKEEQAQWKAFCRERSSDKHKNGFLDFATYSESINKLKQQGNVDNQDNPTNAILVETIIILANKLGIKVIATGVENEEQIFFLSNIWGNN
jgi:EAL domain-containing protein (putative c-di-GMP-specific phosphodiesterase class I)